MSKKKTHKQYVEEVAKINPNIEVIGEYVNTKTKILHRCEVDGYEWYVVPKSILKGHGCPKCGGTLKLTHEEYIEKVSKINSNIKVLGVYIDTKTKILHRCEVDNFEWMATPDGILHGRGCPKCGGTMNFTHEEYVKKVAEINKNIEVIDKYVNTKTKILHKCKIDGQEWYAMPTNILKGTGCPKCSIEGSKKAHENYVKEIALINPDIEVLDMYVNTRTKILHKCKTCGHKFYVKPNDFLHGIGCPKCNASHGERDIELYLIKHKIDYIPQHRFIGCRNKHPLPFDFYLPDYNVCIEYNGKQHYEPIDYFGGKEMFNLIQQRDAIKTQYCKDNNIVLIKIKYNENIEEVLDDFLGNNIL